MNNGLLWLARGWLVLDREDFFTFIMSAVRANVMRQAQLVAIGAGDQMGGIHREMAAAAIASAFG